MDEKCTDILCSLVSLKTGVEKVDLEVDANPSLDANLTVLAWSFDLPNITSADTQDLTMTTF
jgi:hypothetical protein